MKKLRKLFTKWYIKRGYTFGYDYTSVPIYSDGLFKLPGGVPTAVWGCPRWVRPLLIFFSPSVYYNHIAMRYAKAISDGILDGLLLGEDKQPNTEKHEETCVSCGRTIPEGQQVCFICEKEAEECKD